MAHSFVRGNCSRPCPSPGSHEPPPPSCCRDPRTKSDGAGSGFPSALGPESTEMARPGSTIPNGPCRCWSNGCSHQSACPSRSTPAINRPHRHLTEQTARRSEAWPVPEPTCQARRRCGPADACSSMSTDRKSWHFSSHVQTQRAAFAARPNLGVDRHPRPPLVAPSYPAAALRPAAPCPDGGIGRRTSFRCWRSQGRGGSSPLLGTIHPSDSVRGCPILQSKSRFSANSLPLTFVAVRAQPRTAGGLLGLCLGAPHACRVAAVFNRSSSSAHHCIMSTLSFQ